MILRILSKRLINKFMIYEINKRDFDIKFIG